MDNTPFGDPNDWVEVESPLDEYHDIVAMTAFMEAYINVCEVWEAVDVRGSDSIDYWVAYGNDYDINIIALNDELLRVLIYRVENGMSDYDDVSLFCVCDYDRH